MSYVIQRIMDGRYLLLDQEGREHWITHATSASKAVHRDWAERAVCPGEQVVTIPDTRPLLSVPGEFKCS